MRTIKPRAVVRGSRNRPGITWSPSACSVRAYAVDATSAAPVRNHHTNSQPKSSDVPHRTPSGDPGPRDSASPAGWRAPPTFRTTAVVRRCPGCQCGEPSTGCRASPTRRNGVGDLEQGCFVRYGGWRSFPGFRLQRCCCLAFSGSNSLRGGLRGSRCAPGAPVIPAAKFAVEKRYKTETRPRPDRHLTYSHGKFLAETTITHDKGQVWQT